MDIVGLGSEAVSCCYTGVETAAERKALQTPSNVLC